MMRCHTSLKKTLGLLSAGVLMLVTSWFCTTLPELRARIAGWFGLVFFALCFLAIFKQLFRTGPSVILDDCGINDLRSPIGTIPWTDIVSLRIGAVKSQHFLCVELRNPDVYISRLPAHSRALSKLSPALGFPPITLSFSGLSPGLEEVWRYLQERHPDKLVSTVM